MFPFVLATPSGWRLAVHKGLQVVGGALAMCALVATFLPWHEVRDSGFGDALGCAFLPDCHVTQTPREVLLAAPPEAIHSGLDHGGLLLAALLGLLVAARVVSLRRPRAWLAVLVGMHTLAAVLAIVMATLLIHMFDLVTQRAGWIVLEAAAIGLAVLGLVDLISLPVLFLRRREAPPAP